VYTDAYHQEVLSKLNPADVYRDLKDSVLLCWEGPSKFCHRHIVASWLEAELGVIVTELT